MTIAEQIRREIDALPVGQPFTATSFLEMAERSNVDKTLGRLAKAGVIVRASRGVYVRPEQSRFGAIPPEISKIVAIKVQGEPFAVHGAEALRQFGLSTQVPVKPVFCTTSRSRTFRVGKIQVKLQQVSPRKLAYAGTNVGTALSALWYLGKERVDNKTFTAIRAKLTEEEYSTFKAAVPRMPGWMLQAFHVFERSEPRA